jgi:adenylate cyclase class IV/diadenosine tetraphosphate (Ap4A) HIT family hydrolase
MAEELKIRIHDYKKVEENLKKLGAKFTEEISVVDTYFKQPSGEVLKITEDDKGNFLVNLKLKEGKFQILKYEKIDDVNKLKKELTRKFGIKCVLKKKRRFFDFEKYMININLIENVGEFLIVEGENLTKDIITEKLGIRNPEFITVSFDELKMNIEKFEDEWILWKNNKFMVNTPENPHLSPEEGCHIVIRPVELIEKAWDNPKLCGEAFELASKVAKIIIDERIADWCNLQYNNNWGLLQGEKLRFHVHVYGRKKTSKNWGQPVELPKFPKTFKNKPLSKDEKERLIIKFKEILK